MEISTIFHGKIHYKWPFCRSFQLKIFFFFKPFDERFPAGFNRQAAGGHFRRDLLWRRITKAKPTDDAWWIVGQMFCFGAHFGPFIDFFGRQLSSTPPCLHIPQHPFSTYTYALLCLSHAQFLASLERWFPTFAENSE